MMRRLVGDNGSYEDDLATELEKEGREKAAARARQEAEEAK